MFKKITCLLLAVVLAVSLCGCESVEKMVKSAVFLFVIFTTDMDDRASKEDIFQFVTENETQLLQAIKDGDFSDYEEQGFIQNIDDNGNHVDFYCGGAGFASETDYVGFYYSSTNDMAAVWCAPYSAQSLSPSGDGYFWKEAEGDNRYYVEMICDHFYYYEASY